MSDVAHARLQPVPRVSEVGTPKGRQVLLARRLRPVLFSEELALALADRVEWGEPDAKGWYTPTLYTDHANEFAVREPA